MSAPDQFSAVRARRIRAEASEIALRTPGSRPTSATTRRTVQVLDAYPVADMAEIANDPENGRLPIVGLITIAIGLILSSFALWLGLASIDWPAVLDFIAPTAAQARDTGWAALSEGL